jgi:hypothetical protein
MGKRLTVTSKWSDVWFMKLSPQAKLIYLYIIDNCDHIGVYEYNEALMKVQIGFSDKVDIESHIKEMGDKVEWFSDGAKIWVVNFIHVHYGVLGKKSSIHRTVVNEVKKYRKNEKVGQKFSVLLDVVNQSFTEDEYENDVGYTHSIINTNTIKKKNNKIISSLEKSEKPFLKTIPPNEKPFSPPKKNEVEEVMALRCDRRFVNPEYESGQFVNFYESKGWRVGQQPMKKWEPSAMKWADEKMETAKKTNLNGKSNHQVSAKSVNGKQAGQLLALRIAEEAARSHGQ